MRITQTISINSTPDRIYQTLMSSREFALMTGAPAEIAPEEGGAFSCFAGQVTGRHIQLLPDARIIQAWRVGPWPEGQFSIVKFDIAAVGGTATITLEHVAFPEDETEHLQGGWHKMYWEPLKSYLES